MKKSLYSKKSYIISTMMLCFVFLFLLSGESMAISPKVSAGYGHSVLLKSNGRIETAGSNRRGQLGNGTTTDSYIFLPIGGPESNWGSITTGRDHTVAIRSDGTLWAWGDNSDCEIGDWSLGSRFTLPVHIGTDNNWVSVSAGDYHTLALKSNGTLWAWGSNLWGQLGNGSASYDICFGTPTQVGSDNDWTAIAGGPKHSLALKANGTLWAWGDNSYGQLGLGSYGSVYVPTQVGTDSDWASISGGMQHSVALKSDGSVWAWGMWTYGPVYLTNLTPTRVGSETGFVIIDAAVNDTLAIKNDGSLWGWGFNFYGELGDGTRDPRSELVRIGTDSDWSTVSTAGFFSLALKNDGTLWAWGNNDSGQFGNFSTNGSLTPLFIASTTNVIDADIDGFYNYQDCNDNNVSINPSASEIFYSGVDENCNGMADDDDVDHDGYGISDDCNDDDSTIHPGAIEINSDGIDQDCNGYDLTINITKATYSTRSQTLTVEAKSDLNASANLQLSGYGPMTWNRTKWTISMSGIANPGTVNVSGVEGSTSSTVTTVR